MDLRQDVTEFYCFVADTRGYKSIYLNLAPELHTSEVISIDVYSEPYWIPNDLDNSVQRCQKCLNGFRAELGALSMPASTSAHLLKNQVK